MGHIIPGGGFLQEYNSECGQYNIKYTNLYPVDGEIIVGTAEFSAFWEADGCSIMPGTADTMCGATNGPVIKSADIDISDAKRACREHWASLTTDEQAVARIVVRNPVINRTGNFLKKDLADPEKKLTEHYIKTKKAKLIKLVKERHDDPYDNTPTLNEVDGVKF